MAVLLSLGRGVVVRRGVPVKVGDARGARAVICAAVSEMATWAEPDRLIAELELVEVSTTRVKVPGEPEV